MEIIRNPNASAKDRIAASDRLQRIRKQKPRGRQFKRSTPANAPQPEPIRPQTESEKQLPQDSTEPLWEEENRLMGQRNIGPWIAAVLKHLKDAKQELELDINAGDPRAIEVQTADAVLGGIPYIHGAVQPEREKAMEGRRAALRDYREGKPLNYRWWTEQF
jgi:hypothetical protein